MTREIQKRRREKLFAAGASNVWIFLRDFGTFTGSSGIVCEIRNLSGGGIFLHRAKIFYRVKF